MDAWREKVIAEAISWIGTPYHPKAKIKGVGVDCGWLLIEVFNRCGLIPKVDPGDYAKDWHLHHSEEKYLNWVEQFADPVETPQPGDVAIYRFGRTYSHGTIVIDWPTVVHAHIEEGQVLYADATSRPLEGRKVKCYSWRVQ